MITPEIIDSLKAALTELRIAEIEMNRPHEDVVSMSGCYSARHSLNSLLRTYLMSVNADPNAGKSLRELLDMCVAKDARFSKLNINDVLCNTIHHEVCDGKYCMSVEKVNECVTAANHAKEIVLENLKIKESELN